MGGEVSPRLFGEIVPVWVLPPFRDHVGDHGGPRLGNKVLVELMDTPWLLLSPLALSVFWERAASYVVDLACPPFCPPFCPPCLQSFKKRVNYRRRRHPPSRDGAQGRAHPAGLYTRNWPAHRREAVKLWNGRALPYETLSGG